jgi:hypothetical protein
VKANLVADDVRRFIHDNINSVEQLEVLLLLRAEPHTDWNAEEVSRRLFTVPDSVSTRLEDLHALGLLKRGEGSGTTAIYCYGPQDMKSDEAIAKLDRLYRERKDTVIQLIFSRPPDRIQTFSDAFRLRREG